ncbi:MAG: sulfatase-like hydrolase/transferase, partial [Opitutales bacterium]
SPPWKNGFQRCFSTEAKTPTYDPMWKPKTKASGRGWDYIENLEDAIPYGTHYWNEKGDMVKDNLRGDDSRVIMDRAIPFIEEAAKAKKPFFTIVWFHTPHLPVVAGPKHAALYGKHPTYAKNYYGCVTAMDEQVGRLRAKLRQLEVADNTMLWFCSDNGPEGQAGSAPGSAGPFRGRKRSLNEGGIRVPGLLEWPALTKPGSSTDFPAVTSDYLPTILDVLGIEYPDQRPVDGISLMPVLKGELKERDKPIGFAYGGKAALTGQRYKILRAGARRAKPKGKKKPSPAKDQLFDLLKDPGETNDLAAKHPEILKKMAQQLDQWLASCSQSNQGIDYPEK